MKTMDVIAFNRLLNTTEIAEEPAARLIENYYKLKKKYPDSAIIEAVNKEKFVALLRVNGQSYEKLDLCKEDLSNLDFSDFIFNGCRFEYTNFEDSNMDSVEFDFCSLDYAVFHGALMECSCFRHCSCKKTDFSNTHLLASYIEDSDWSKADASDANLLEIEAYDWEVEDMVINENTSVGEGEFSNVDWSKTNVANLNISIEQVKYFLQSTAGGKFLNVYTNYKKSSFQQREDSILEALLKGKKDYLDNTLLKGIKEPLIFISYASEQEAVVKDFYCTHKNDFPLWMDVELKKEEPLRLQIETIISKCSKAVIFLSKAYLIKAWTRYEFYRLAEEAQKRDMNIFILTVSSEVIDLAENMLEKESSIILINTMEELIGNL